MIKAKLGKGYGVHTGTRFQRVLVTDDENRSHEAREFVYDIPMRAGWRGPWQHTNAEAKEIALERHRARKAAASASPDETAREAVSSAL